MSLDNTNNPGRKALEINLDRNIYGTFAEIGAGQEVARWFFQVGGASGTIAKSFSAYDMTLSDLLYGKEPLGRYVSRSRLEKMLEREYSLLVERLQKKRGNDVKFFVFANTMALTSYQYKKLGHGWIGMRFMHAAGAEPSEVLLHVELLDCENIQQQEALGTLGVNLIYGSYTHYQSPFTLVHSLMDGLSSNRLHIDVIEVRGPAFNIDSRLLSLELVKKNYCRAILFNQEGLVCQPKDILYKKNLLLCRGSFRPPTKLHLEMLNKGAKQLEEELSLSEKDIIRVAEISMHRLWESGNLNNDDFLARVELLSLLKQNVLISNCEHFYQLKDILREAHVAKQAFVLGIFTMDQLLEEIRYHDCPGGIMEGLGTLLDRDARIYLCPTVDESKGNALRGLDDLKFDASLKPLVDFLKQRNRLQTLKGVDKEIQSIWARQVLNKIRSNDPTWEVAVPSILIDQIKKKKLFIDVK